MARIILAAGTVADRAARHLVAQAARGGAVCGRHGGPCDENEQLPEILGYLQR